MNDGLHVLGSKALRVCVCIWFGYTPFVAVLPLFPFFLGPSMSPPSTLTVGHKKKWHGQSVVCCRSRWLLTRAEERERPDRAGRNCSSVDRQNEGMMDKYGWMSRILQKRLFCRLCVLSVHIHIYPVSFCSPLMAVDEKKGRKTVGGKHW